MDAYTQRMSATLTTKSNLYDDLISKLGPVLLSRYELRIEGDSIYHSSLLVYYTSTTLSSLLGPLYRGIAQTLHVEFRRKKFGFQTSTVTRTVTNVPHSSSNGLVSLFLTRKMVGHPFSAPEQKGISKASRLFHVAEFCDMSLQ